MDGFNVPAKFRQITPGKSQRALGQAVSRRCANCTGAAHNHVADGTGGGAEIFGGDDFEFVREQPLFDEPDGVMRAVKGDGAAGSRAAADGDVHKFINPPNR